MKPRLFGPLAAAILSVFILADSCNFDDPFPQYQGVNLIEGRGFEQSDLTAAGAMTPGVWTWAWKESEGDSFDYMKLEPAGTGPSGGAAYELSLENLYAGDGTFETTTISSTPIGWMPSASATAQTIGGSTTGVINGNTLWLNVPTSSYVGLDPTQLINGLSTSGQNFVMHFRASGNPAFQYASTFTSIASQSPFGVALASCTIGHATLLNIIGGTSSRLYFGTNSDEDYYIDDIRILRFGPPYSLRLLLRRGDTSLPLIPGFYRFSFQVKTPSATRYPESLGTETRYSTKTVTSYIRQRQTDGSFSEKMIASTTPTNSQWTPVISPDGSSENVDIIEVADDVALLELIIYPTDPANPDAGSVLIADPVLEYFSKGF